ncbi:MAG: NAD+ synthase [Syntrophomonas sp.]
MKISIAQLNPLVGDLEHNLYKIRQSLEQVKNAGSQLLILPELFLTGYPPRDMLEMPWFIQQTNAALLDVLALSKQYPETAILLGIPQPGASLGKGLYNSALLIGKGKILFQQSKSLLPTYDVFDETRYFDPVASIMVFPFGGERLGISICEDAWNDPLFWPRPLYNRDPIGELAAEGASLLINISASPFQIGKDNTRYKLLSNHACRHGIPLVYVNQVGANDELIFDGQSMVLDNQGMLLWQGAAFEEELHTIDLGIHQSGHPFVPLEPVATLYQALSLGIRDYLHKSGFKKAVLGLSGGIDSAVTACLAVHALGPDNVLGLLMPSPYSSSGSVDDSLDLAARLGIKHHTLPINDIFSSYQRAMQPYWEPASTGLSQENIQARIRGNLLMAFSNAFGCLVLSTGNKSELAVGYCTLYGDMSGGLSVLSDVPKIMVYELARYINRHREVIPEAIVNKAPSAELRPDQKDQDSLPPYEILDQILYYYIEENCPPSRIVDMGFDKETVSWVVKQVDRNEFKRRQAAPGLKVSSKAFGGGRRMPIAARWQSS